MINQRKAEILGLLFSDGNFRKYYTTYKEFDKRRNNTYIRHQTKRIIEFANTNLKLLNHFRNLLLKEYDYKSNITISNKNVFRICITKNGIINDLTQRINFGFLKWSVPREIMSSNKKIKAAFIRGIFDGDGSIDFVDRKIPRIRIYSVNLKSLKQVKQLLEDLFINCKINGPYIKTKRRPLYELLLQTKSIMKFIKYINSNHSKKLRIFKKISREYNNTKTLPCRGR